MKHFLLKTVLVVIINILLSAPTQTANVYVSSKATKVTSCGSTVDDPCGTIQAAVNIAKTHDEVTIIASDTPYTKCPIIVDKPLTIHGIRGIPVIDCEGSQHAFKIEFSKKAMKNQTILIVEMSVLKIRNAKTAIFFGMKNKKTNVRILNLTFEGNDIDVNMKNSPLCYLRMNHVNASGSSGDGIQLESCQDVKVMITNTRFHGKYFKVVSTSSELYISMKTVTFDMKTRANASKTRSPVHIETAGKTSISVSSSRFSNHEGKHHGSVSIISPKPRPTKDHFDVLFNKVTFANNSASAGNGSAFSYGYKESREPTDARVKFMDCTFQGNSAFFRGGALWFEKIKSVHLMDCNFLENQANGPGKGQGGAIFAAVNRLNVKNCRFRGNSASKSGGTLHVVSGASAIKDTIFRNARDSRKNGILGDVMYVSKNQMKLLGNVTFDLESANSQKPIVWFKSGQEVLEMSDFTRFVCPRGYHYEDLDTIDIRHGAYHFFGFTCSPCPDQFYSVSRGYHLVEGDDVPGKCRLCPYGASCDGTIRARKNFWGVTRGDEIEMVPCPRGYCCDREPCGSYDLCASHRTGTLCGRCENGFSEGISSTVCQPNNSCRSWYVAILIICMIVLILFLLFQQELIDSLTKILLWDVKATTEYRAENDADEHDAELSRINQSDNSRHSDYQRVEESKDYNHTMGYVKVFIYFYQVVELLRVSSYANRSSFSNGVIEFLMPFLNLQFGDIFTADCLFENITPVIKTLFKNSVCFFLYAIALLSYLVYLIIRHYKFRSPSLAPDTTSSFESRSYPVRLTGAIMHIILLSYVALTQLTFKLLQCVQVGDRYVLHIDGSVVCYQPFQGFFWLFFATYIVFFPFVLIFGRKRLVSGRLSPKAFIFACFFPLFLLAYWGYGKLRSRHPDPDTGRNYHRDKIMYILQHPYKEPVSGNSSMLSAEKMAENWESVLMFRRLFLVLTFIFIDSFLLRSFLLLIFSFLFLLHHLWVQPFTNAKANTLETISLSTLMLFSGFCVAEASSSLAGGALPLIIVTASAIEDYVIALLPIVILLVILSPRIKHHFDHLRKNNRSRSTSFQPLQEVET